MKIIPLLKIKYNIIIDMKNLLPNFKSLVSDNSELDNSETNSNNNSNNNSNSYNTKKSKKKKFTNTVRQKVINSDLFRIGDDMVKQLKSEGYKISGFGYTMNLENEVNMNDRYLKKCNEDQNEYSNIEVKRYGSQGSNILDFKNPIDFLKLGYVIPIFSEKETPVLVKKQRRKQCYKDKSDIKDNSIELDGVCYKSSQCKNGYCKGELFGLVPGVCKKNREKKNVKENDPCASSLECAEGLECSNTLGGIIMGKCKSKKKQKLKSKSDKNKILSVFSE